MLEREENSNNSIYEKIATLTDEKIRISNFKSDGEIILNNNQTLIENFLSTFSEDMSDKQLFMVIFKNSFYGILGKIVISLADSVTTSFLGYLSGDKLYPYFIGCLIQNVGFRGVGFGLLNPVSILCSQAFGLKNMKNFGRVINQGRIVGLTFSFVCLLFCFTCKPIISSTFGEKDVDLIQVFLLHNIPTFFFTFQILIQLMYFNSQNQYFYPAILDSFSLLSHFIIFLIFFNVFKDYSMESPRNTLILTAWCINLNSIFHFIMYIAFTYIKKLSPESNFCINKNTFKNFWTYIKITGQCVLFFISHFVASEILSVMINNYNGDDKTSFNINKIVNSYYFIFNKVPLGLSFFSTTVVGNLLTKNYFGLLRNLIRIIIIYSAVLALLIVAFTEVFANYLAYIYTNKEIVRDVIVFLRISILVLIPNNFEMLFQGIIAGYGKQKVASIVSVVATIG